MTLALDHLVVAARTLSEGAAWCEATLGVAAGSGGRHAQFGTHNLVAKIATATFPLAYLEIIAIDAAADATQRLPRPRWFALDEPAMRARLDSGPRLVHWVARTDALADALAAFVAAGHDPGLPLHAWRDTPRGWLEWQISVPQDGALACGGALPTLIAWRGTHPAHALAPSALALRSLQLRGVPAPIAALLSVPGVHVDTAPGAALRAELETPRGLVTLQST